MDADSRDWIPWSSAWARVVAAGLSKSGAPPSVLATWAQSGLVTARATSLHDGDKVESPGKIPTWAWEVARAGQAGKIDWATGNLQCYRNRTFLHAFGVEFQPDEFDRLVAPPIMPDQASPTAPSAKRTGGAPKQQDKWDAFWLAVVQLAVEDRLTLANFQSQKGLRDEILLMMDDGFNEDTIKEKVRGIWSRWVDPQR